MRFRICSLVLLQSFAFAQQAKRQDPPNVSTVGSIVGHVYCSDTNTPARFAKITLFPISDDPGPPSTDKTSKRARQVFTPVQTVLDGSFTIPRVEPGYYYVIVQYPGYVSPVSQLTGEDFVHPSLEMQKFIASVLPTVSVAPNRVTTTEIHIQRGASIDGIIHFDDGGPAPNLYVTVLHKDKMGHWMRVADEGATPDDQGRYRIIGLPAGEYLLQTDLSLSDELTDHLFNSSVNQGGSYLSYSKYTLSIFSGGVFRQRDAKSIKLGESEDDSGEEIVIPISKIHSISGSITQARTGRVVNAGTVALLYPDDNTAMASVKIGVYDSTFHFDFVPEGNYILKVTDARDVTREELPAPPDSLSRPAFNEIISHNYGPQEQPITVVGDMSGILIAVPEKSPTPKPTP